MSTILIARVILRPDANVCIALYSNIIFECSIKALEELLANPVDFVQKNSKKSNYKRIKVEKVPQKLQLETIPGLTLLKAYSNNNIVCVFPGLFDALFSSETADKNNAINLKKFCFSENYEDDKHMLLSLFLETTNYFNNAGSLKRKINIDETTHNEIYKEIFNTALSKYSLETSSISSFSPIPLPAPTTQLEVTQQKSPDTSTWVTVSEYAELHGLSESAVTTRIARKQINNYVQVGRKYYLDPNEKFNDGRCKKNDISPLTSEKNLKILTEDNYKKTQEFLKKHGKFSDKINSFIRNIKEAEYYLDESHGYVEVEWNGKSALILDINPNYYCAKEGKTNKQLIKDNHSPVVPNPDTNAPVDIYHIHHIGQKTESPFAIIPDSDHNKKYASIFHEASSGENVHDNDFQTQKKAFWKTYLAQYTEAKYFNKISRSATPHKRRK